MDEQTIRNIVQATITELIKGGLLKSADDLAYAEIKTILTAYYNGGEREAEIRNAIEALRDDPYYKIIPLNFGYGYTLEQIAEALEVETTTIVRNKKRLCLSIYRALQ